MAPYKPTSGETHRLVQHLLYKSQQGKCAGCPRKVKEKEMIIEHRDDNPANFSPDNIAGACRRCNKLKSLGIIGNFEREKKYYRLVESSTEKNRRRARLKRSPIEIEINQEGEPKFRVYLWQNVNREGGLLKDDAINEGAAIAGVNVQTTARWLGPATSRKGPFRIETVDDIDVLRFRATMRPKLFFGKDL